MFAFYLFVSLVGKRLGSNENTDALSEPSQTRLAK